MAEVIFIGGTGRCGTNILRQIMGDHPSVASLPFEYRFLVDPDGIVEFLEFANGCWSPYMADMRLRRLHSFLDKLGRRRPSERIANRLISLFRPLNRILTKPQYSSWELDKHIPGYKNAVDKLIESLTEFTFAGQWVGSPSYSVPQLRFYGWQNRDRITESLVLFVQHCIDALTAEKSATHFVEDNTWNILFADKLLDMLPQSRFIHIYRDPRDVVASFCKQSWAPSNVHKAVIFYRSLIECWLDKRDRLDATRVLEVRFEDLVNYPQEQLRRIFEFSGLDIVPNSFAPDPSRANIGRWLQDFSAENRSFVEQELRSIVSSFGYGSIAVADK